MAEYTPSGMAINHPTIRETTESTIESAIRCQITSLTGTCSDIDCPQSPREMIPQIHFPYWT